MKNAPVGTRLRPGRDGRRRGGGRPRRVRPVRRDGAPAHVIVSSFWPASLAAVRRRGARRSPPACSSIPPSTPPRPPSQAAALGCAALHPFHAQATPALVDLRPRPGHGRRRLDGERARRRGRRGRRRGRRRDLGPGRPTHPGGPETADDRPGPHIEPRDAVPDWSGGAHPRGQSRP